jgi:uncharacterized protein (DUF1330 family)
MPRARLTGHDNRFAERARGGRENLGDALSKETHMKKLVYSMSLVAVFALGHVSARWHDGVAHAQTNPPVEKAAYLVAASNPVPAPAESMAKYREAAGPLARQAGVKLLGAGAAGSTLQVLEGKWPYQGRVAVERFRSMKALLDFWNSPEYQKARKFRSDANFIIAVEAVE